MSSQVFRLDDPSVPRIQWERAMPAVQKGLLVATVACAALSLIPPLRFAGALATRAVATLSASANSAASWNSSHWSDRVAKLAKIAIVVAGLVGVAASSPMLIVASIAADIGFQAFEMGNALYNRDYTKALTHLGIIVIDALALSAVVTGSWQLMAAAASVSAFVMSGIVLKMWFSYKHDWLEMLSYAALSIISSATSDTIRPIEDRSVGVFTVKNPSENYLVIQPTIPTALLPTVPIGGPSIVTKELT